MSSLRILVTCPPPLRGVRAHASSGQERAHHARARACVGVPVDVHEKLLQVARDAAAREHLVDTAHGGGAEADGARIAERGEAEDEVQQRRRGHVRERHPPQQLQIRPRPRARRRSRHRQRGVLCTSSAVASAVPGRPSRRPAAPSPAWRRPCGHAQRSPGHHPPARCRGTTTTTTSGSLW
jgi:hypothetical protein